MNRYGILLLVLFGVSFSGKSQNFSSEVFHDGFLVTADQDTVRGLLKYDMEANVIQLVQGNIVKTYTSNNAFYFQIYDKILHTYRQFYSIPFNVNYNYKIPIFFELQYEGKLSFLTREAIVQEAVNSNSAYWGGATYLQDRLKYSFYFLDKSGKIEQFTGKRSDLYSIMARYSRDVKNYVQQNKLRTDEVRDLIRITAFYNAKLNSKKN